MAKADKIAELVQEIKIKKELQDLDDSFVKGHLLAYLQKEHKLADLLLKDISKRSTQYKKIIKEVRAKLRKIYGLFRPKETAKKIETLISNLVQDSGYSSKPALKKILSIHSSTKERWEHYSQLYQEIFTLAGRPKIILDLGCGVNPFSIPLMHLKNLKYYAYDLSRQEIFYLKIFFRKLQQKNESFKGYARLLDITKTTNLKKLPKADLCFLFKMTDVLEKGTGHKKSEQIIKNIPAKHVVVSFPTLTMSGKRMNYPERKWIELMCHRLGYHYWLLKFPNEVFYVLDVQNG